MYDQELLSIVATFQQWKYYSKNNYFFITILTNYNNLRYFIKMIIFNKRQFRWALALAEFDFKIKYYFEKINSVDELLRRSDYEKKADNEICLFIL